MDSKKKKKKNSEEILEVWQELKEKITSKFSQVEQQCQNHLKQALLSIIPKEVFIDAPAEEETTKMIELIKWKINNSEWEIRELRKMFNFEGPIIEEVD